MGQAREYAQSVVDYQPLMKRFEEAARTIQDVETKKHQLQMQRQQQPMKGNTFTKTMFNLSRVKSAQVQQPDPVNEQAKAEFIAKYLDRLLRYDGSKGENDNISMQTRNEIMSMASPVLENDVNDALEQIQATSDRAQAQKFLGDVYDNFIAPGTMTTQMEPVMSENAPKGIIKFNLSDHVLNNKKACYSSFPMEKTAADQFGQQYLLYGPESTRICPKLRGKNMSVGDVVSEYICRHHCIDGITIDDARTVCGEALWRAHVMDKFSREYVDKDGKTVGGYINKRFEINRNVPEENRMRLKPGETRKPRPAEWGSLESRMQAMRAKEGEKRGYAPETDTKKPFNWTKDVDKNTMEEVRNPGSKFEGKDPVNNPEMPKKAFNLSTVKTAQGMPNAPIAAPTPPVPQQPTQTQPQQFCKQCQKPLQANEMGAGKSGLCQQCSGQPAPVNAPPPNISGFASRKGFNLKEAQGAPFEQEKYDFTAGEQKWSSASDEALYHTLQDLRQVINIQEDSARKGGHTPKLGHYWDELHTVVKEMNKRGLDPNASDPQPKSVAAPSPVDDGRVIEPVDAGMRSVASVEDAWWMTDSKKKMS